MSEIITLAKNALLEPAGLGNRDIETLMGKLCSMKIDYADMYFQYSCHESWSLEEGRVKSGSYNQARGVGVRAISGEKTGFAYSDAILLPSLSNAVDAARSIAKQGTDKSMALSWPEKQKLALYSSISPVQSLGDTDKVQLLEQVDKAVRKLDPRIKQVTASLSGVHEIVLIARSDGGLVADIRPLVRLNVNVIVEQNGRREQGSSGGGGRFGYQYFLEDNRIDSYAKEAVDQALTNLDATGSPAGEMQVVLGPGWPGILLHEAIGHGLEGDFNRKGTSAFSNRIGEQVASPLCTVVDDGTIADRRGSMNIDDEGTETQNTMLIEKGILRNYMQDTLNARLMGVSSTGNGRRESYAHLPMPRMTNTYMLAGETPPEEIIASVKKGLYAKNFGGGQVDITSGKFVFSASEAYLIENGKIGRPVKGATLIGNGPDVLTRVSMVGNDLKLDPGVGTCGKEGQSVPVGVGQPTLKIDGLTVGGTQE